MKDEKIPKTRNGKKSNIGLQAAARLAALRKEEGLTLKVLAERTGLSEAYLSRLENFKAPISLDNLEFLSDALNVPIELFFKSETNRTPMVLCRANEGRRARFRGKKGFIVTLPAEEKLRKIMEPLIVEVHTSAPDTAKQSHQGEEFNYVLEGRCEFQYGKQTHILEKGDSVYFDSEVPHAVRPIGKKKCRVLAVVGSNEYAFHGNLKSLLNDVS